MFGFVHCPGVVNLKHVQIDDVLVHCVTSGQAIDCPTVPGLASGECLAKSEYISSLGSDSGKGPVSLKVIPLKNQIKVLRRPQSWLSQLISFVR